MDWLFEALDLPSDRAQRHRVDAAIRDVLALPEGVHCPEVWAAVKALDDVGRADLAGRVGAFLGIGPTCA